MPLKDVILAALIEGFEDAEEPKGGPVYFRRHWPTDNDGNEIEDHDIYLIDGQVDLRALAEHIAKAINGRTA